MMKLDLVEQLAKDQIIHRDTSGGRKLSNNDKLLIKRKLGIKSTQPFPLCPARDLVKARKLSELGDNGHLAPGHACDLCRCTRIAGSGTVHFGYGWCFRHEKGRYRKHAKMFAERHLLSIQQRNPSIMANAEDFSLELREQAVSASKEFRLTPAAVKVHNMLDSFYTMLSEFESNSGYREHALEILKDLKGQIECVPDPQKADVIEQALKALEGIEHKMRFPLTERGGREMSSEVRYKLISSTLKDVAGAMKIMWDIQSASSVSADRFRIWLHKLHQELSIEFGELTYVDMDGKTHRIMDGIASVMMRIGEPKA